jgi:hypothetical protein
MVRAATTGAFDYTHADPYSRQWRLKHLLVLGEMTRQADLQVLTSAHEHWLAYVTHSNLDPDSWANCKNQAADTMQAIQSAIFPWFKPEETESEKDTITSKYGGLIESYKRLVASRQPPEPAPAPPVADTK